jgi:hypothetical protein
MEFKTQEALEKYLRDHPRADKSNHTVRRDDGGKGGKGGKGGRTFSKKHKVHLRGITEDQLDAFYGSPAGEEVRGYNIEVIAGADGVVDAASLERAVSVRERYLAVERAKSKPKSERTKADDDALDVCQSTPACEGNLGVSRSSMPQFIQVSPKAARAGIPDERFEKLLDREKSGKGLPSDIDGDEREAYYARKDAEAAIAAGADPDSDVSVFDDWVKKLRKGGVKVTKPKGGMRVGDLKATQSEISADAVLRNADKYLRGGSLTGGVIYVSSDGHILDGHHRWAGLLTADPDARIPVVKIGVPMAELLEKSFDHPGVFRQDFRFDVVSPDDPLDLARKPGSTWQQRNGKWYGKNRDGKSGGPFATQDSARDFATGKSGKSAGARLTAYRGRSTSTAGDRSVSDTLRTRIIRLAHTRPELRPHLLPLVSDKAACGWGGEAPVTARFEEGVSADPTENMSPEDAAEWEKQNALHRDKFTKGASGTGRTAATIRMISDPGHGWLEVPVSELARLGIARKISRYSFRKGRMAYLEEDMDAGTYLEALDAAGEPRPDIVEVHQDPTPIRGYPQYKSASGTGRTAGGRVYVTDRAIRESFGNGVEDVLLVVDRGAKKPFAAALQVLKTHRAELEQMDDIYKIKRFVDGKVLALTGKTPQWHSYSMPD